MIKEWREKRDAGNAKRAEQFARQREETVAEAQRNIDDFYDNYNNKKEKQVAATRKDAEQFLASREDTTSGGTSWERVAKIVDVSGKGAKGGASGSGKERFRELLTSLRKDEKAPGATGVSKFSSDNNRLSGLPLATSLESQVSLRSLELPRQPRTDPHLSLNLRTLI